MANNWLKSLSRRIVETSYLDKETGTLFSTNPGISANVLKALAKKNNLKIGQTKDGSYVSIPLSAPANVLKDTYVGMYDNFMDTYTYFNKNWQTLLTSYRTFDLMEENLGEVDLILDTYVSETLSAGFIEDPLKIKISNPKAQDFIEKVFHKNKIFEKLPLITKNLAKYGNYGLLLYYPYIEANIGKPDFNLREIDVLRDLTIRTINPKYFQVNCDEMYNPISYETMEEPTFNAVNNNNFTMDKLWQPWQFVHFMIPSEETQPYGKSMLWSMRSAFDQLSTLEALLAVSRASNVQRLVISIPVPDGASVIDAYQYMNEIKNNYNNSIFTNAPGTKGGKKIQAATEVLYKPAIEGFDISTLEAKIDLSNTDDVEYFLDKILRNSNLPKGYLVGDDTITTAQTLESQDLKLQRTLIPLRKALITGMTNLVEDVLTHGGYDVSKMDIELSLEKPVQVSSDQIAKYSDILEVLNAVREMSNNAISTLNQFQFLIELGFPENLAMLVTSNNSIAVIKNKDLLKKFLKSQTVNNKSDITNAAENIPEAPEETKEAIYTTSSTKLNGKTFLLENVALADQLKQVYDLSKSSTSNNTLYENIYASDKKIIVESK